jgi:hypothetical protein
MGIFADIEKIADNKFISVTTLHTNICNRKSVTVDGEIYYNNKYVLHHINSDDNLIDFNDDTLFNDDGIFYMPNVNANNMSDMSSNNAVIEKLNIKMFWKKTVITELAFLGVPEIIIYDFQDALNEDWNYDKYSRWSNYLAILYNKYSETEDIFRTIKNIFTYKHDPHNTSLIKKKLITIPLRRYGYTSLWIEVSIKDILNADVSKMPEETKNYLYNEYKYWLSDKYFNGTLTDDNRLNIALRLLNAKSPQPFC